MTDGLDGNDGLDGLDGQKEQDEPAPPTGLSALTGLRVVEMGVWVAAPSAGALLADWGADVIKVEPPSGDPMRSAFGALGIGRDFPNPAFAQDNRGKRSVVLDLRQTEARERLEELLSTTDVFLTNLRPTPSTASTSSRGPRSPATPASCTAASADTACAARTAIVRPTTSGRFGPARASPSSWPTATASRSTRGAGIGDHISGLAALAGLLAAVLEQRQTGRGRVVEDSLLRTGTYVLGWDLSLQETVGKVAKSEARHSNQTPLMNSYRTRDGRWFFFTGLEADRHIDPVLRALGRPDLRADARFADARSLRANRTEVIAVLDDIVGERTLGEWAERFDAEGVWWAPAQGPADVLADPQLAANDGFLRLPDDTDGTARRSVNGPVSFSDLPVERAALAPFLGEHTEEVLAELGTLLGARGESAQA